MEVLLLKSFLSGELLLDANKALRSAEVGDSPDPPSGLKKRGGVP
jgi:hypothetical protein